MTGTDVTLAGIYTVTSPCDECRASAAQHYASAAGACYAILFVMGPHTEHFYNIHFIEDLIDQPVLYVDSA